MRKSINLFSSATPDDVETHILKKTESVARTLLIVFGIVLVVQIGLIYVLSQKIADTKSEGELLSSFIDNNLTFSTNLKYFQFKNDLLNQYLEEDSQAWEYYSSTKELLNTIDFRSTVQSFDIFNDQSFLIEVGLPTYDSAITFLEQLENDQFASNFHTLKMESFDTTPVDGQYILKLAGTFKEMHGN